MQFADSFLPVTTKIQIVVGGSDESGQQFTFDNAVDIDDDDDYDGGNYGTAAAGIAHPGAVANFANFDDVSFESNFDFGFHTADATSMNAETTGGERAQSPASSSASIGGTVASATGIAHPGAVANFANFDDVSFEGNFDTVSAIASVVNSDLFADFGPSSNNFDDIKQS